MSQHHRSNFVLYHIVFNMHYKLRIFLSWRYSIHNAPDFILPSLSFLCSSKSFQMPSKCTMYGPCSHCFCSSILFQMSSESPFIVLVFSAVSIVSNYVRMHASLTFPVFKITPAAPHCLRYRPNAPFTVPVFLHYLYSYKYRQNATFTVLVFKIPRRLPSFSRPSPLFQYNIYIIFLIAVIFQNSVKRQALATLFS